MNRYVKMHALPKDADLIGDLRPFEKKDVGKVAPMLREYLKKFDIRFDFSDDEIAHYMLPRDGVMYSYVVEDLTSKKIPDFISFY